MHRLHYNCNIAKLLKYNLYKFAVEKKSTNTVSVVVQNFKFSSNIANLLVCQKLHKSKKRYSFVDNLRRFSLKVNSVDSCENSLQHDENKPNLKYENPTVVSQNNSMTDDDNTDLFDNIDYDEITGGDSDTLNKLKLVMLEVDVLRQDGYRVPKTLSSENWKELLTLKSRNQKRRLLDFLWTIQMRKINDKKKREVQKVELEKRQKELLEERKNNDHITYGFQGTTIFLRVYDSTINHFDNQRLIQAMLHGINIVVDCGYDAHMSIMENKLCAKQLCYLFAENRLHRDPFNIHFTDMNRSSVLFQHLKKFIPTLDDPGFPMNISEEHYTKLFPKEKLVYLTPHCRTELKVFNADDIYIIGAMVDKHNTEPLSLAKAKSEGIRMANLPLDRYLDWELGTKSLTINQVSNILLDVRTTGDWNSAFKHVPQRKLKQPGEPKQDMRRLRNRGSIFQPPANYRTSKKFF